MLGNNPTEEGEKFTPVFRLFIKSIIEDVE